MVADDNVSSSGNHYLPKGGKTMKFLRHLAVVSARDIKRSSAARAGAEQLGPMKGFVMSEGRLIQGWLHQIRTTLGPGESVKCYSLKGGRLGIGVMVPQGLVPVGGGIMRQHDANGGAKYYFACAASSSAAENQGDPAIPALPMDLLEPPSIQEVTTPPTITALAAGTAPAAAVQATVSGVSSETTVSQAAPLSGAAATEQTANAVAAALSELGTVGPQLIPIQPPGNVEVPSSRVLQLIPEVGIYARMRNRAFIPANPPRSISYVPLDLSQLGRLPEFKVAYYLTNLGDGGDHRDLLDCLYVTDSEGNKQLNTADGIANHLNLLDTPPEAVVKLLEKQSQQQGIDTSILAQNPQTTFEDSITAARVEFRPWHLNFIKISQYNPSAGVIDTLPLLSTQVIDSLRESTTVETLGRSQRASLLDMGVALLLAVYYPATFPELVTEFNRQFETLTRVVPAQGNAPASTVTTQEFERVLVAVAAQLRQKWPVYLTTLNSSPVLRAVKVLIAYSRVENNQPDRFAFGAEEGDMRVARAILTVLNTGTSGITNFNRLKSDVVTGDLLAGLKTLSGKVSATVINSHPLLRICSVSVADLPNNLALSLAQERERLQGDTLRAQLIRRFMIAYRALLLYLSATNPDVFNALTEKR